MTILYRDEIIQRFREAVRVGKPDECWEWQRGTSRGYGTLWIGDGTAVRCHVIAWELHHGKRVPMGTRNRLQVYQTCKNKRCCNPSHLVIGEKGRAASRNVGAKHPRSKLTEDKVIEARKLYDTGNYTYKQLATMFHVATSAINDAVNGRTWRHIDPERINKLV